MVSYQLFKVGGFKKKAVSSQGLYGDVEGNLSKVVDGITIFEVSYNVQNSFIGVLMRTALKFWLMTCTSLGNMHLGQVLLSFEGVNSGN